MTPESFHEIAEASGDVLANALLSSEADRLGGYVLGLNGCSSGRVERQALELMAYSVELAAPVPLPASANTRLARSTSSCASRGRA